MFSLKIGGLFVDLSTVQKFKSENTPQSLEMKKSEKSCLYIYIVQTTIFRALIPCNYFSILFLGLL